MFFNHEFLALFVFVFYLSMFDFSGLTWVLRVLGQFVAEQQYLRRNSNGDWSSFEPSDFGSVQ